MACEGALQFSGLRARAIKAALKELVPDYMVPKKIVFHEEFALNVNGKIDRKALA